MGQGIFHTLHRKYSNNSRRPRASRRRHDAQLILKGNAKIKGMSRAKSDTLECQWPGITRIRPLETLSLRKIKKITRLRGRLECAGRSRGPSAKRQRRFEKSEKQSGHVIRDRESERARHANHLWTIERSSIYIPLLRLSDSTFSRGRRIFLSQLLFPPRCC